MSTLLRLSWEPVCVATLDDYVALVFVDGTWELNWDGNDVDEGNARSMEAGKRAALGSLGRHIRWRRGARYLGRRYNALILPPPEPNSEWIAKGWQDTTASWELQTRHPDHPLTSWSAGRLLVDGKARSVRAGQVIVERLLRHPKADWRRQDRGTSCT